MAQITQKELSYLADLLSAEQLCSAQYCAAAAGATDAALKERYTALCARHQRHFDQLYTNLK